MTGSALRRGRTAGLTATTAPTIVPASSTGAGPGAPGITVRHEFLLDAVTAAGDDPVLRLDEMPAVEAILMPSGGFIGGVGEPTIAVAAPAVLNAVFAATGKRVRQIPASRTDLKRA